MLWSAIRHIIWVIILLLVLSLISFMILLRDHSMLNLVTQNIYNAIHLFKNIVQGDFGITYNGGNP